MPYAARSTRRARADTNSRQPSGDGMLASRHRNEYESFAAVRRCHSSPPTARPGATMRRQQNGDVRSRALAGGQDWTGDPSLVKRMPRSSAAIQNDCQTARQTPHHLPDRPGSELVANDDNERLFQTHQISVFAKTLLDYLHRERHHGHTPDFARRIVHYRAPRPFEGIVALAQALRLNPQGSCRRGRGRPDPT